MESYTTFTPAAGDVLDAGDEVLLRVVDGMRAPWSSAELALGRTAGGANELQPQRLGPLAGDQAHATGRGMEQDVVTGLQAFAGSVFFSRYCAVRPFSIIGARRCRRRWHRAASPRCARHHAHFREAAGRVAGVGRAVARCFRW